MSKLRRMALSVALPAVLLALLVGCAAPVQYEYNSALYGQWHTFAWKAPNPAPVRNPVVDSGILATRVKRAAIATLTDRGYRYVRDPSRADFLVTYHTSVTRRLENAGPSVGVGVGYGGFGYPWWWAPFGTVMVNQPYEVREAELILDVISTRKNQLVWRGWLTSSISRESYSQPAVNKAVARIFSKFPPPPKF
jgi:hypothetical protein